MGRNTIDHEGAQAPLFHRNAHATREKRKSPEARLLTVPTVPQGLLSHSGGSQQS